ncbi:hypothetical protein GCM10025868_23510 [Angustibacter aerolatus]|uniref:Penicillin-binding protein transpeptidase domain-containing protein n=1 Tax=Angustibacter aerolatus TaxID=1162965 RepID=A0ABQ6JFX0_9ACTN|nr:penicillin-binding transpeptidase domain-containing protein [Angustibacter aerolatus]GMA87101.1 hypothetical protein GCM10025868_23510 [Angustibacter aerolatus]
MPTSDAKGVRVGLTAIRPGDGAVVAMYGGKDYVKQSQNAATQSQMQAGSTFKPFALAAALEDGVSIRSRFDGGSPRRFDGFQVRNFGGEQFGPIDLVTATEHSVNTVYAALNEQVGPKKTKQAAIDAGYPKDTPGLESNPVNVLGSASPHVIDVANAYATFASLGERATPYTVKSVTGPDGKKTYKADVRTERAFSKDSMRDLTYALQGVVRQGTGAYAGSNLGRPAAGKTGTSSSSVSAWFAGYTPRLSAAVGMYRSGTKDGKSVEPVAERPRRGVERDGRCLRRAHLDRLHEGRARGQRRPAVRAAGVRWPQQRADAHLDGHRLVVLVGHHPRDADRADRADRHPHRDGDADRGADADPAADAHGDEADGAHADGAGAHPHADAEAHREADGAADRAHHPAARPDP